MKIGSAAWLLEIFLPRPFANSSVHGSKMCGRHTEHSSGSPACILVSFSFPLPAIRRKLRLRPEQGISGSPLSEVLPPYFLKSSCNVKRSHMLYDLLVLGTVATQTSTGERQSPAGSTREVLEFT